MKKMKTNFDPKYLSRAITHCVQESCPLSESCLHYLAYRYTPPREVCTCYDVRLQRVGDGCPTYLPDSLVQRARGFCRGLSRVPSGVVKRVRSQILQELGWGLSTYYSYRSGHYSLDESQQGTIRQVLAEVGVEGEVFDGYEWVYTEV